MSTVSSEAIFTSSQVEAARKALPVSPTARTEYEILLNDRFPNLRISAGVFVAGNAKVGRNPATIVKGLVIGAAHVVKASEVAEIDIPDENNYQYVREHDIAMDAEVKRAAQNPSLDVARKTLIDLMNDSALELRKREPAFYRAGLLLTGRMTSQPVAKLELLFEDPATFAADTVRNSIAATVTSTEHITIDTRGTDEAVDFMDGYSFSVVRLHDLIASRSIRDLEP